MMRPGLSSSENAELHSLAKQLRNVQWWNRHGGGAEPEECAKKVAGWALRLEERLHIFCKYFDMWQADEHKGYDALIELAGGLRDVCSVDILDYPVGGEER